MNLKFTIRKDIPSQPMAIPKVFLCSIMTHNYAHIVNECSS